MSWVSYGQIELQTRGKEAAAAARKGEGSNWKGSS